MTYASSLRFHVDLNSKKHVWLSKIHLLFDFVFVSILLFLDPDSLDFLDFILKAVSSLLQLLSCSF